MGLTCGVGCVEAAQRGLGPRSMFFRSFSNAIFFDIGAILGGFGRPKWRNKLIFGRFFSMFFSNVILASFLGSFLEGRTLKIQ